MASRGAKYFLALSRRGAEDNPDALKFIAEIEAIGALVWAPACDTTDKTALKRVLEVCSQRYPPIKGCIQGAMVLRVRITLGSIYAQEFCRFLTVMTLF
jgi:hypothetical protein